MKRLLILCLFTACGYSSKANEVVGQVKKVIAKTPIICDDFSEIDVSMGVLRNGVGSVSKEDLILWSDKPEIVKALKDAAASGQIVNVTYDAKRLTYCVPEDIVTKVEIVDWNIKAEATPK